MDNTVRDIVAQYGRLAVDMAMIDDDADLYRAGLTSHASINLMLALEEAFGVEFPQEMLRKKTFASVNAIQSALAELIGQPSTGALGSLTAAAGASELVGYPGGI